jgi:DNA-directed RNA polymerase I subunit RPA1
MTERTGDLVDINRIRSNDIHAMLNTYGVEAARSTIINEIMSVFKHYSISVNRRHIGLLADYMTFQVAISFSHPCTRTS